MQQKDLQDLRALLLSQQFTYTGNQLPRIFQLVQLLQAEIQKPADDDSANTPE